MFVLGPVLSSCFLSIHVPAHASMVLPGMPRMSLPSAQAGSQAVVPAPGRSSSVPVTPGTFAQAQVGSRARSSGATGPAVHTPHVSFLLFP